MAHLGPAALLGPAQVRELAAGLDLQPTKKLGQNFVVDANTVRKIVREAEPGRYKFSDLIKGIVRSAPFQMRQTSEGS